MIRAIKRVAAFAVLATALVTSTANAMSEDEYRESVLTLFLEFLQMKDEGVFLDFDQVRTLQDGGYKFPNDIRGDNEPGGFFARPPGSEWLAKVQGLRDSGHNFVCFDTPKFATGHGVCGFQLFDLYSGIIDSGDVDFLDAAIAKFWVAWICYRSPDACDGVVVQ